MNIDASSFVPSKVKDAWNITWDKDQEEKVRAFLKLFLVPSFKPEFIRDDEYDFDHLEGDDILDPVSSAPGQIRMPIRMFDVDTGNMVPTDSLGHQDHYCVLSHSWKGSEITYGYVLKARQVDRRKAQPNQLAKASENYDTGGELNDVQMIHAQCADDIEESKKKLEQILQELSQGPNASLGFTDVGDLLYRRTRASTAEFRLGSARQGLNTAIADLRHAEREEGVFKKLMKDLALPYDEDEDIFKELTADIELHINDDNDKVAAKEEKVTPKSRVAQAQRKLGKALVGHAALAKDIQFFQENRSVSYAVDELLACMQRRKSAVKIEESIKHSKRIFDMKPFQSTGKRYVWLDTCCIDKSNSSELAESLALMGEWYTNAEFCLVHLDSSRSDMEWVNDWNRLQLGPEKVPFDRNYTQFDTVHHSRPEWATRGWTLQELVLSKVTFYVNALWEPLDRPIETLGPYYYYSPFIGLYLGETKVLAEDQVRLKVLKNVETLSSVLGDSHEQQQTTTALQGAQIHRAQRIVEILNALGFVIPKWIDEDSARAHITQSVHVVTNEAAATQYTDFLAPSSQYKAQIIQRLCSILNLAPDTDKRRAINLLLRALVEDTVELIRSDRKYIAQFSHIGPLQSWKKGVSKNRYTAHEVMLLAAERRVTNVIDKAYSLMGILGVQFPAFPAEGLAKALCRTLDEVVITSNDVSVFNWTGKHRQSTIKGRSLYPSSIEAYQPQKAYLLGQAEKNKKLAEKLEIKRFDLNEIATNVTKVLDKVIKFMAGPTQKSLPIVWLQELQKLFRTAEFKDIEPHLINIATLLAFIEKTWKEEPVGTAGEKGNTAATDAPKPPEGSDTFSKQVISRVGTAIAPSPPPADSPALKASSYFPSPPKLSVGSFKSPLGFGKKQQPPPPPQEKKTPVQEEPKAPAPAATSLASTFRSYMAPKAAPNENVATELDAPVKEYIQKIAESAEAGRQATLPFEGPLKDALKDIEIEEFGKSSRTSKHTDEDDDDGCVEDSRHKMICPNPIIVNSSGIKGVFDIQRVIVTMLQPKQLRKQVTHAASDNQIISGWCTISTGFSMVMVGFACESDVLAAQLDICDVVNRTVLADKQSSTPSMPGLKRTNTGSSVKVETPTQQNPPTPSSATTAVAGSAETAAQPDDAASADERTQAGNYGETVEAREVSRMIDFVQEPNLNSIAGEWVLARFSGVAGAKWFLCRLEMGSTHEFYGRRIPTDEFDFKDGAPEKGLIAHWGKYIMNKKERLCGILGYYLDGKAAGEVAEKLKQKLMGIGGDDSDDENATTTSKAITGLELASWKFREVKAGVQGDMKWQGELNEAALRGIPLRLRAAIQDLDANKDLLPSMFHSGREIHMF